MYPVKNTARDTRTRTMPATAWPIIKLVVVCVVTAFVPYALYVRVDSKESRAAVTVQAARQGGPYLNLQNGQELHVDYRGDQNVIGAMQSGQAKPRALASADLNGDAAPDLLAGYAYGGIGILTIQRGNPEAFAPKDDSVFLRMQQGYNPSSLLPTAQTYQVPEPADFLQAGDFNNDNRKDVLVGSRGRDLFLLAGDGQGNLAEPVQISLSGVVTAVAAGQFRAPDGRTDLAVGIDGPSGPQVLIYDGINGVTSEPMRLALASPATALEFGEVDDSPFMGLAIATGSEINVIHGWGRKQSPKLESRVERIDTGMNVRGLASGFFIWSREGSKQLAALGDDGTIRIFGRGELNTQPFTDLELTARARLRLQQKKTTPIDVETLSGWQAAKAERWTTARELVTGNFVGADATAQNLLRGADVSLADTDDLLVLGSSRKLDIIRQVDTAKGPRLKTELNAELVGGDFTTTSLESADAPATVLALPQKLNGYRDLFVMQSGSVKAIVVPLAPTATIDVDRTDDPAITTAGVGAAACTGAVNDCSLRGAVQFANANSGTVIQLAATTYVLNTNGANGCVNESLVTGNTIGDLEINATTTVMGVTAASTIIRQAAATNDRVICMNVTLAPGRTYSLSSLTITGGRDVNSNVGGGGIIGGAKTTTLNLTSVTIANNQTTGPNISGGGGVAVTGGDMNVMNCTFGAANNPGANRNDLTLGNASNSNSGGGLSYSAGDPTGGPAATGTLTVSGTTFTHNDASSASAGGGGLLVFEFNTSSGTANINTSAFTSNRATGTASGGGIMNESMNNLIISTTSFTSNSAGNRGGGLYVGGGLSTLLDGTAASITFSGNTATTAGSSISAAGAVFVSGTNTIVGGDLEITTNGIWTNNPGSVISPTNFIMTGTANFTGNNSTTNVGGNFNFGSGTFNAGTGVFNFNGTTAQSITNSSLITFNNLTDFNTTQPLTLNNSFNVNGTLNINGANAIFAPVAAAVIGGTGTLTGTGTARVTRTGANAFFTQYTMPTRTLTNLTVEYIGAAAQTASVTTYNVLKINNGSGVSLGAGTTTVDGSLLLTAGALAVGTNTLVINNGTTVVGGTLTSGATGTVNYNQGSAGQNVIAANYGNLTFSAQTKVLAPSGIIGIAGTFNPNGVTTGHTIAGSTIDFNGTGAQTVPVFNYHSLTISGARAGAVVTLAAGTIGVAGAFNHTATGLGSAAAIAAAIAGNTADFNGSAAQTIGGSTTMSFNHLTISNATGVTQNLATINVAGNWTNNGLFNANTNTVVFNGSSGTQTVSGNTTFYNLTHANAGATTAFGATNTTVAGTFSRTAGTMDPGTGTFTFTGGTGSIAGASAKTFNHLVISGGATILNSAGGNLTIKANFTNNGTFIQAAGINTTFDNTNAVHNFAGGGTTTFGSVIINAGTAIDAGSHNFNVQGGNFTVTGTFTGNTGTVTFIGTIGQTIGGAGTKNFNNLTINNGVGGSVATSGSSPSVSGLLRIQTGSFTTSSAFNNVQIDSGATLAGTNATTMNVTGNWTNGGSFISNGNTVNFNGNDNTQTLSGNTTFNNLTINHTGTGGVTASGSTLAVTGLLRVQGGTFTSSSTFNNVQIDSGGTLASDGGTMNVSGDWTNNGGTFTPSTGIVNFNGAAAQAVNGTAASQTFGNFVVNKSAGALSAGGSTTSITTNNLTMTLGTFTAPATLDINGNTLLTAGTLTAGANITAAANWTNNGGVFTAGAGTVTFDGGVGQTIGGTTATTFGNLTNGNASGLAMAHDNTVNGILALTSGDVTVANTKILTQPNTGTSSGAFDVVGNVKRTGFVSGGGALSFGNPLNTIRINSGAAPPDITVLLAKNAPLTYAAAVLRSYTITPNGGHGPATLRLHYRQADLNGNDDTSVPNFNLRRFNGSAWQAVVPTSRNTGVPEDNWLENNAVTAFSEWTFANLAPTAASGIVRGTITDSNGKPVEGAVVRLGGDQTRKTITDAKGRYYFDNVQANGFYTVAPSRANYNFNPSNRSFNQSGNETEAGFGGIFTGDNANPLDTAEYFVRQQYVDILGREPDEGGFNYWSDEILRCGSDAACANRRRRDVAAAFFIEQESQLTGSYIYDLYKSSLGRRPVFAEYSADRRQIVGGPNLDAQKAAFAESFVQRAEFVQQYQAHTTAGSFVDALLQSVQQGSGVDLASQRDNLVAAYNAGGSMTQGRALVMRAVADNAMLKQAEYNAAFVLTEYFSYLRRDPEPEGYAFWLNVVTNGDVGNYRGMVCAFITSAEYQKRFSANVTHTNGECGN